MIPDIREVNFPEKDGVKYATLRHAECNLLDMGEKTITTQVKIDGNIAPDFSYDWEVVFLGEKYIMPLRKPQGAKDNNLLDSTIDLTFQHWAIYQLKRKYFFTVQPVSSGTAIPDKYIAPVSLNLKDFCNLFGQVLAYYFGDKITIDFNDPATHQDGWEYSPDPVKVEISHSYVWDVLIKLYELYAVRWQIEPNGDVDHYVIKVGYPTAAIDHIFEYGFEGGLLKVERQVQSDNIRNEIIGRGGEKNLPFRYFKDVDPNPNNPTFRADPDWIPELANVPFTELYGATFRSYVQGWKAKRYGGAVQEQSAYAPWAWRRGYTDEVFNPIEFVADEFTTEDDGYGVKPDSSIAKYGELMGGLENDSEIYPSIQGVTIDGLGRIDQIVDVEPVSDEKVADDAESKAQTHTVAGAAGDYRISAKDLAAISSRIVPVTIVGKEPFTVPEGQMGNLYIGETQAAVRFDYGNSIHKGDLDADEFELMQPLTVTVRDYNSGEKFSSPVGLPAGTYTYEVTGNIQYKKDNTYNGAIYIFSLECAGATLQSAYVREYNEKNTFDIWIKNVWQSSRRSGETDAQYIDRVWTPILGDREGQEAKIVFTSGMLGFSEDYEFTIIKGGIHCDNSRYTDGGVVPSEWRLTLARSEAEAGTTGLYIPNSTQQARVGDSFIFTGIDLPHQYVVWAEQRVDDNKKDELRKVKEINPTWVVSTDRVRLNNYGEAGALIDQIKVGASLRLADKRFITNSDGTPTSALPLYVQSITYSYREPTNDDTALNPDVEIVLSDQYMTTASPVEQIAGEVSALSRQIGGSISNIEQVVRAVGDRLYLRKDGILDRSVSPTEFANLLTSYGFRQGMIGGAGWGFYRDANGSWVLETDRIKARQDFEVNNLIVNQILARGGMVVESAATLEISTVEKRAGGYRCYFDQKRGTVWNLFRVGDIALCHRFYPQYGKSPANEDENEDHAAYEKFYKRRVVRVGQNYVDLENSDPEYYVGEGVPDAGDVIVQYGHYTDLNRQYVIVRDVIGGGYERFIEGLNSVRAVGTEYYFVGKQAGMYGNKARFYVGNVDNFIEYVNGKLNVKADVNIESTFGGQPFDSYISGAASEADERKLNHALLTSQEFVWSDFASVSHNFMRAYSIEGIKGGDKVTLSFDYDLVDLTYNEGANIYMQVKIGNDWHTAAIFRMELSNGMGKHFVGTWDIPASAASVEGKDDFLQLCVDNCAGGTIKIRKLMFQKSDSATEWRPNINDPNYLISALRENTTLSGGLILTSLVEVGNSSSGSYVIRAGMSGIDDSTHTAGGVAFWAGGTYEQAYNGTSTYAINMDGTGHAAGGTIKFLKNKLQVGPYVALDDDGLDMTVNGNKKLRIGNHLVEDAAFIMSSVIHRNFGPLIMPSSGRTGRVFTLKGEGSLNLFLDMTDADANWANVYTKTIGAVPKGANLKFNNIVLQGATSYDVGNRGAYFPQLIVKIRNGVADLATYELNPTLRIEGGKYRLTYSLENINHTFKQNYYNIIVSFQLKNNFAQRPTSLPWESGTESFNTGVNLEANVELPQYDTNTLGADGTQMSWGTSNMLQQNNFWGVRVGSYGISIGADNGIRIMTPNTNGWIGLADYIKSVK